MGVKKVLFGQFVFDVSSVRRRQIIQKVPFTVVGLCRKQDPLERGRHRHASVDLVCSAESRRLTRYKLHAKQELSYRKQIARQLRTQYVEGIHRPKYFTVTLKSRSRLTQGHWKRNHWTDHTRLTISRVI